MKELDVDIKEKIQKIANTEKVAIIGFVAPQEAVRTSPVTFSSASIDESDMYKLGEIVQSIKNVENPPNTLHLVIQTPGGELYTSYKIAWYLRNSFEKIKAYVPYQAASGGTLFCCAANEIYLGDLGNLTPIDPQIRYKGARISAYAFERAVDTMKKLFGEYSPDEVPTPWQQMAEKIDPIVYDEMQTAVFNTYSYARELLKKSGYNKKQANMIAYALAMPQVSHDHPYLFDGAKELGLNILDKDANIEIYNNYVSARLKEKSSRHIIEHFVPIYEQPAPTTTATNNPTPVAPATNI